MIWLGLALSKLAFLGLSSSAILFALDILRTRRVRLPVASDLIWGRSVGERDARSMVAKWKRPLSFLLHAAIALLLVLALGDPRPRADGDTDHTAVFVLDVSASMQARDVLPNRLAVAKEHAHAAVRALGDRDRAMVVVASSEAVPKCSMTSDRRTLDRAIDEATATDAPADIRAALVYAADVLRGVPHAEVRLFSDGQLGGVSGHSEPLDVPGITIEYDRIGKEGDNLAITECSARRNPFDREHFEMLVEVTNTGARAAHAGLTVLGDGRVIDSVPLSLGPGEKVSRTLADLSGADARLEAVIAPEAGSFDYLALDDHAYAVLPPAIPARVLRVSPGNAFLDAALALDGTLDVTAVSPAGYVDALSKGHFDVVIFDGVSPIEAPAAHALYIDPRGAGVPVGVGRPLVSPGFDKVLRTHAIVRHVDLADVNIKAGHELRPSKEDVVIGASGSDERPIMVAGARGEHRFVALGFDLRDSDIALRAAFPLFIAGTVRWLLATSTEFQPGLRTGELWRLPSAAASASVLVSRDGSAAVRAPVVSGHVSLLGEYAGYYDVTTESDDPVGDSSHEFAANLASAAESSITPAAAFEIDGHTSRPMVIGPPRADAKPWVYLVLSALLLAFVEWALFHRRIAV